jgi:acyl carrier protein
MNIENEIIRHIQNVVKDKQVKVEANTSLIAKGLLDSLEILGLIEFVESQFKIKLKNEDMNPDYFETPAAVSRLVQDLMGGTPTNPSKETR